MNVSKQLDVSQNSSETNTGNPYSRKKREQCHSSVALRALCISFLSSSPCGKVRMMLPGNSTCAFRRIQLQRLCSRSHEPNPHIQAPRQPLCCLHCICHGPGASVMEAQQVLEESDFSHFNEQKLLGSVTRTDRGILNWLWTFGDFFNILFQHYKSPRRAIS